MARSNNDLWGKFSRLLWPCLILLVKDEFLFWTFLNNSFYNCFSWNRVASLKFFLFYYPPFFQDLEVPWHLITIAIFFTLIKLPGPYYPYWGRIFIPHMANGGLFRTLWSLFLWFRRPRKTSMLLKHKESHLDTAKKN